MRTVKSFLRYNLYFANWRLVKKNSSGIVKLLEILWQKVVSIGDKLSYDKSKERKSEKSLLKKCDDLQEGGFLKLSFFFFWLRRKKNCQLLFFNRPLMSKCRRQCLWGAHCKHGVIFLAAAMS